jgi:hypothetical protein
LPAVTTLCSVEELAAAADPSKKQKQMGVWERKAKAGAIGGATGFMVGGAAAALQMRGRHAGPAALFLACVIGFGAAFRQT